MPPLRAWSIILKILSKILTIYRTAMTKKMKNMNGVLMGNFKNVNIFMVQWPRCIWPNTLWSLHTIVYLAIVDCNFAKFEMMSYMALHKKNIHVLLYSIMTLWPLTPWPQNTSKCLPCHTLPLHQVTSSFV